MYNKLFTKILDSSIWLAPDPIRLVWITLIAAMDEDGNAMFACVENLAARARVTVEQAEAAIKAFESPDPRSGDPENDGIRIQRFPGGWHVLNAHKYRAMVTKAIIREQTRARTAKWRAAKSSDAPVTQRDESVTPSEAEARAVSRSKKVPTEPVPQDGTVVDSVTNVFDHWRDSWNKPRAKLDAKRKRVIREALTKYSEADCCQAISGYLNSPHHTGQNERRTIYDDIELFLRDAKHIDAGLRFYANPPRTDLSDKTRKIIDQTENWVPPEMRNAAK